MKNIIILVLIPLFPLFLHAQNNHLQKLNIEKLFELAEQNSRSIRTYDIAAQEAGQAVRIAKNNRLPSIDISLSASFLGDGWMANRDYSNGSNAPMPHFGNNFALEASQIIYAGGAISSEVAIAQLQQQIAQLDKEKNRQDIRFLLLGNYLELYKFQNQTKIYAKNIEQTQRLLTDIKARQKEGLALRNDITRYELQLKSLELALLQIKNSRTIINNQLITTIGLPQETIIEIDTTILTNVPLPLSENHWQEEATTASPVLKQAQIGIEQAKQNEKIAKAELLPSIALIAGDHLDGPIIIEVPPINKNFNYWFIGIGIKFNIASVYKSNHKVRKAQFSTQRALENEKLLQENIQTGIKAAYIHLAESFTIYETQIKSLELANQNYDVIKNRYLNELAIITDMLDASNSKLSAELQVSNAQINILFHYYNLKKAAGNL